MTDASRRRKKLRMSIRHWRQSACIALMLLASAAIAQADTAEKKQWRVLANTRTPGLYFNYERPNLEWPPVSVRGTRVAAAVFTSASEVDGFAAGLTNGDERLVGNVLRRASRRTIFERESLVYVYRRSGNGCCPQELTGITARSGSMRLTLRNVVPACPPEGCLWPAALFEHGLVLVVQRSLTGKPKRVAVNVAPDRVIG